MSSDLSIVVGDFTTQLATKITVGGTTATLQSATDDDGVALPAGRYFFTLDGGNSSKEHIVCDLSGTSLTNIKTVSRQGVEVAGAARIHRIGATVVLTDFKILRSLTDLLDGSTDLDATTPLGYDGTASITTDNQLATKAYVDGVAIAGAPDASTTVKGITKMSAAPASPTEPIAVGTNDGRVPTQDENNALVGNNTDIAVGTGNKFVTQTGFQHNAEKYAADGSGSSTAYTATLSPVPTSYTDGMLFYVKIGLANTTTTPTLNVNSLGAKTIVKKVNTALAVGDIAAGQFCIFQYDGTNMVLQKPATAVDVQVFTANGTWTKPGGATAVLVQCIGGGGSGGGGAGQGTTPGQGGSGGGGGAYAQRLFVASDLAATVAVTVAAAVSGGAGGTSGSSGAGSNGTVGNTSTFGTFLSAFGGGAGKGGQPSDSAAVAGASGGGTGGAGTTGASSATLGGAPATVVGVRGAGGSGSGGVTTDAAPGSEYGGACGGGQTNSTSAASDGGSSLFAAGGGGGGGPWATGNSYNGGAGGNVGTMTKGGGGAAGTGNGGAGTAGTAGTSLLCGTGGGGGAGNNSGIGGVGGAGGDGGGGGGGGGAGNASSVGGAGGAGARGEVRVITYF